MIRICKRVVWVFLMALLMLASCCYLRFQEEQRWLAVKAPQITDQAGAHTQRERIMALRDYLAVTSNGGEQPTTTARSCGRPPERRWNRGWGIAVSRPGRSST